jgi:hypothetical protein
MRAASLTLALSLLAALPAAAAEFDIPWFEANPTARAQWLRACRDDTRIARDARCGNAEIAENRVHARRLGAQSGVRSGQLPPAFETPMLLDAARVACAKPPAERGLLGRCCPRGS